MRAALIPLLAAACGDNSAPPDSSIDAFAQCAAQFTGNFAETSSTAADCPTLVGGVLELAVPVARLQATLDVMITLPAAVPGELTSDTVANWSALALERIGDGGCAYRAGATAVPEGSFALTIRTISPLHGTLAIAVPVLTLPSTECGGMDVENIKLSF